MHVNITAGHQWQGVIAADSGAMRQVGLILTAAVQGDTNPGTAGVMLGQPLRMRGVVFRSVRYQQQQAILQGRQV